MSFAKTAVIAGGGIGGLATAVALAQRNWNVQVFERQPQLRESGAGITFSENGLRVLEALGVYEQAMEGANPGTGVELRGRDEMVLDSTPLPSNMRLLSSPRAQVLKALETACTRHGVQVHTGNEVVSATDRGQLRLADGTWVEADLALGIDGIWSKVRTSLGIATTQQQTTEGALRTVISATDEDAPLFERGRHIEVWNGTRRFLIVPLGRGRIYLALTCLSDDTAGRSIPVDVESWSQSFPHWRHLIERIDRDISWNVYSIIKTARWSVGRSAILGDAAHAQPPNLGQGGGMAVQNGLALACMLESAQSRQDIPEALQAWEASVRELTDHCQRWSVLYGEIAELDDAVRNRVISGAMSDPWIRQQLFIPAQSVPIGTGPRSAS